MRWTGRCSEVPLYARATAGQFSASAGNRLWVAKKDGCGYGRVNVWEDGVVVAKPAHRAAYAAFVGPIQEGHDIDHRIGCSRACIAPDHLTPVPYKEHRARTQFSAKRGKPKRQAAM